MRRRTRRKNNWFPVLGTLDADDTQSISGQIFSLSTPATAGSVSTVALVPLIPDITPEEDVGNDSLVDYIGSEYIIERIVGKLHFALRQDSNADADTVIFACGLFVARAENTGATPIGTAASFNEDYGPLHPSTAQRPWMWRRTWAMSNLQTITGAGFAFPQSTSQGSVLDGPHVDCKSKRKVRKDERLWLAMQSLNIGANSPTTASVIRGYADLRVLGRLVKARNRSAF